MQNLTEHQKYLSMTSSGSSGSGSIWSYPLQQMCPCKLLIMVLTPIIELISIYSPTGSIQGISSQQVAMEHTARRSDGHPSRTAAKLTPSDPLSQVPYSAV